MITEARKEIIKQLAENHKNGAIPVKVLKSKTVDLDIIRKEITNPLLRTLAESIVDVISRAQTYKIEKEQAIIEIQAYKLLIQLTVMELNSKRKVY